MNNQASLPESNRRILFVLSSLNVGGVETWLVNLVRSFGKISDVQVSCDFLTLIDNNGEYKTELSRAGCNLYHVQLQYKHLIKTLSGIYHVIKRGNYQAVHCQSDYLSGLVMLAAYLANVPGRVFHIHTTRYAFGNDKPLPKRIAGKILRSLAVNFSHRSLACSSEARKAFFQGKPTAKADVFYCGIDLSKFDLDFKLNKTKILSELGIGDNTKIILSVGRMTPEKNLHLAARAISELKKTHDVIWLHAGDGPERASVAGLINELDISENCRLLGLRNDVAGLILASDVFIMPSVYEGLPLVLLEAQAGGIPIIASEVITRELVEIPELFSWLPPDGPPVLWAEKIDKALSSEKFVSRENALKKMQQSKFNIANSIFPLLDYYGIAH